jgi:flavin reductase (DIM6/NTAB) family NADH-FMN oxidoreductase RutF
MNEEIEYTITGRVVTDIDRAFNVAVRGVMVITTRLDNKLYGLSASWVSRSSEQPFLAKISVWKENFSRDLIKKSRIYAINYLKEGQQNLAIHFGRQSGRDVDKFLHVSYFTDITGSPILKDCLAYLDCKVIDELDSGDHTIFLAEVLSGRILCQGEALRFRRKDYVDAIANPDGPLPRE